MSKWIIIYPRGNRQKISIAEICDGLEYEISDYDVASRCHFYDENEAVEYAKELAEKHGLQTDLADYPQYLE